MRERKYQPGELIIAEGSYGSCAYILKSGNVAVKKKGKKEDIVLATLEAKEIFGELGLIDDRPRSASIMAKSQVVVDEITREDFLNLIEDKYKFVIPIFKALFERLRQTNEMVVQLENQLKQLSGSETPEAKISIMIKGITPEAQQVLNQKQPTIKKFPYKIGRESSHTSYDIFVDNDLYIKDSRPYSVSRNHLSINAGKDEFYVLDRGSSMGTIVNNVQLGDRTSKFKATLKKGENVVILGAPDSPYKFKIIV